jgi:hypothetical protein
MRHRLALAFLLSLALLALLSGPAAAAWTYGDTLTLIWRPLPNLPTILRPGDTLQVWAKAPSNAGSWSASLQLGTLSYPLAGAGGGWQTSLGWWTLAFRIPAGLPEEVYDLTLACNATPPDTARHAVKVIPYFRPYFTFAQISDTHVPSHLTSSDAGFSVNDTTGLADFDAVIDDLNLIHPEFVLHTGDLVNEGELEEYLGMYEMGRGQAMIYRLRDPLFLVSGNHDVGGWSATPPAAGTSRRNWWRTFGWSALASPPSGFPYHSQDYSFDYDDLHCVGMEGYQNDGGYDHYLPVLYGAQSMTQEQMDWLAADLASRPQSSAALAFIHYDFGGTLPNGSAAPNGSQFSNLAALGLSGVIWGHNHGVAEGNLAARPFNLGLQSVIYSGSGSGGRAFRVFRVTRGDVVPGPMHHSGGTTGTPTDSLTVTWTYPNNGTRLANAATVTNRFGETWDNARLIFYVADHDSNYTATNGSVAQVVRQGGVAAVYVACIVPASATRVVSIRAIAPVGVAPGPAAGLWLDPPRPNPYRPAAGPLVLRFALPRAGRVSVRVYDLAGRAVATLLEGPCPTGERLLSWDGRSGAAGGGVGAGVYLVRLATEAGERHARVAVLR